MFLKYNWPWIVWALLIMFLLSMPGSNLPKPLFGIKFIDKIGHFGIFFALSLLMLFGLRKQYSFIKLRSYYVALTTVFGSLWAIITETIQIYAKDRSFEFADLIADIAGILLGLAIFEFLKKKNVLFNWLKC